MASTTPKKRDDDELALKIDESDLASEAHGTGDTPAKTEGGEGNRQSLLTSSISGKMFDPKLLAKQCLKHLCASIIAVLLIVVLFGIVVALALVRFNRAKCSQANADFGRYASIRFPVPAEVPSKYYPALRELIKASDTITRLFYRQVWSRNEQLEQVLRDENACGGSVYQYFKLNSGPWSRLDDNRRFVNHTGNVPEVKSPGSNLYADGLTQKEFTSWIDANPAQKPNATSMHTVIRRTGTGNGSLVAVPYSIEYADLLREVSTYLNNALAYMDEEVVKVYLRALISDFATNDYTQSSKAFLQVREHVSLRVQMGPYGVNEDTFMGLKTSFVSYIGFAETKVTEELRNMTTVMKLVPLTVTIGNTTQVFQLRDDRPIYVLDLLYTGGEARDTSQQITISLPHNPEIIASDGVKRLLFINVAEAKFEAVLAPLIELVISRYQWHYFNRDAFIYYCMGRELARGIGPTSVTLWDPNTLQWVTKTVKEALGVNYFTMEELKADAAGLIILAQLANNQMMQFNMSNMGAEENPPDVIARRSFYVTWLAYLFNRVRYNSFDSSQQSACIAFNYLRTKRAISVDKETVIEEGSEIINYRYGINFPSIENALNLLMKDILTIESTSLNAHAVTQFIETYGTMREEMKEAIRTMDEAKIPIEIYPQFDVVNVVTKQ